MSAVYVPGGNGHCFICSNPAEKVTSLGRGDERETKWKDRLNGKEKEVAWHVLEEEVKRTRGADRENMGSPD
jgi:hypothetical protein